MPRPWSASTFSVSCSSRSRFSARSTSSRCTASVSLSISADSRLVVARASPSARSRASRAAAAASRSVAARGQRHGDPLGRRLARRDDERGDRGRPLARLPRRRRPGPGLPLGRGLPAQRVGAPRDGPGPLLDGAQREPGLHLLGPRRGQRLGGGVADLGVGLVVDRLVLGHRELLLGRLQGEQRVGAAGLDGVAPLAQPLRLGGGRPHGLLQRPSCADAAARRCSAALLACWAASRSAEPGGLLGPRALQRRAQPGQLLLHGLAPVRAPRPPRPGRPARSTRPRTRRRAVGAEHVPLGGDGGQLRIGGDHGAGGVEVVDDDDAQAQQPPRRRHPPIRPRRRPRRPTEPPPPCRKATFRQRACGNVALLQLGGRGPDQERRPAGVLATCGAARSAATAAAGRSTATASASSPSAAASAVRALGSTVSSPDTGPSTPSAAEQRAGAVLAGQPHRQRVDPGPPVRPLLLHLALARHQLGHPRAGGLVGLRRPAAALARARHGRRPRRGCRARRGPAPARRRPSRCARRPRRAPRTAARSPRRWPRRRCAAPRPDRRGWPGPPGGRRAPGPRRCGPARRRRASARARRAPPVTSASRRRASASASTSSSSCSAAASASASSSSGSRPGARSCGSARCRVRSCGQPDGAAQPLGQRGEPVPGVLGGGQPRRVLRERRLQPLLLDAGDGQLLLDLGAAGPGRRTRRPPRGPARRAA